MVAKIREIESQDNPQIAALIRQVLQEFEACGPGFSIHDQEVDFMYNAYHRLRCVYFVIENNGQILGGAGIAPLEGASADICELKKMYLMPKIRGQGWGEKILNLCLQKAREFNYHRCYLETLERMSAAGRLYEKFGFERTMAPQGNTGHFSCDRYYELWLKK